MLTIAQITDLHITSDKDPENKARNEERLRAVLKTIHGLKPRPVAIIASGDLVDRGEPEEYVEFKRIISESELPVYLGMGNHDARGPFLEAFPNSPVDKNGFIQYAADIGDVRLIMLDTLEGKNDGGFCKKRASWLRKTLNQGRRKPTIIAFHHPPIASGIQWMGDPTPWTDWVRRLADTVRGRKQVRAMICGHLHRAFHAPFAGHIVSVSPATSIQLTLNLSPVDVRVPDHRQILLDEPPGFSILMWDKGEMTVHVGVAGDFPLSINYDYPFVKD